MPSLGELVRKRREEIGMTQGRLASEAGISSAQISRLESGERGDPSFETIVRLAESLEMSLDELAGPLRSEPPIDANDWTQAGFDEVDEIVPGRHYEVWGDGRLFRIFISRAVVRGSTIRWNSSIDEAVEIASQNDGERVRVWTHPVGIPARHLDDTPRMALADAMRWLADWGGFNAVGRAQRDAAMAQQMDPELRSIADTIDASLADVSLATWRDDLRARWSSSQYDVYISRDGAKQFVMMTYFKDASKHAKPVIRFPMTKTGALVGAARIRTLVAES